MRNMFSLATRKDLNLLKSVSSDNLRRRLLRTASWVGLLAGAHTGTMMAIEGMSLGNAAWLTATTLVTVGYGDVSPKTALGRLATSLLLYGAGIPLMAQAASIYFEERAQKRQSILHGKWRWNMDDHIVFLNAPAHNAEGYFKRLMTEFRKSALPVAKKPAIVVSPDLKEGLSEELRGLQVVHVNQTLSAKVAFENSSVKSASVIVVINKDEHDALSDSVTFDLVSRAREANPRATIIAEAVLDENRKRILGIGADHVIRPMRSYPEMLIRTILAPGSEAVIEDLFNADGEECVRYDIPLKGTWGEVATRLITQDVGVPLAYIDANGKPVANGRPGDQIEAKAVFVIAREGNVKTSADVLKLMQPLAAADAGRKSIPPRP